MTRGRKPTPTALKLVRGNPGKRAINHDEPKPTKGLPSKPPEWLDDTARKTWKKLVKELNALGLLTTVDGPSLGAYCQAVSRMEAAEKHIAEKGIVVDGAHGGLIKNPSVTIAKECALLIQKFASEFGLTPASRTRIKAPTKTTTKTEFQELLEKQTG